jgi:hypothetical protein
MSAAGREAARTADGRDWDDLFDYHAYDPAARVTRMGAERARGTSPGVCPERDALEARLDCQRGSLLRTCQGLTGDQLALRPESSSALSLLGLVRHLADAERGSFRQLLSRPAGLQWLYRTGEAPDGAFSRADAARAGDDLAIYAAECEASRVAASRFGLDDILPGAQPGEPVNLRWVYLQMIEEYARRNGQAELLRERIDRAAAS